LASLVFACASIAAVVSNSFRSIVLKSRRQQDLERFLSPVIAQKALEGSLALNPGGQISRISVLFSDIRGFTSFAENHTPEATVELLNEYFSIMIPVIFRHGGSLDKLLGDGLMAFFGVPEPNEKDRQNAFDAACEMNYILGAWNRERTAAGKEPVSIGIGLDGGKVIVGNLGTDRHLEFTAIGDPVNTASRIQGLTRNTGETLLFSEYIFLGLAPDPRIVSKGLARLKGKSEPVKIYGITDSLQK
jgi:adenylate cyclase